MAAEMAIEGGDEGGDVVLPEAKEDLGALALGLCANCGSALRGPYCYQCGQHVADYHRSVWRLIQDVLANYLNWDNRVFATLGPLLTRPGFLTLEFMAGRRVRFVHPLRLFLFSSAICLLFFHFGKFKLIQSDTTSDRRQTRPASTTAGPQADARPSPAKGGEGFGNRLSRAIEGQVKAQTAAEGEARYNSRVNDYMQRRLSWIGLLLLPIFALLLRFLYWSTDSFYFTHLIFSLHYHTYLFIYFTLYSWFHGWVPGRLASLVLWVPVIYLFQALRRVYGGSRLRTALKLALIEFLHLIALALGLAALGVRSLFA